MAAIAPTSGSGTAPTVYLDRTDETSTPHSTAETDATTSSASGYASPGVPALGFDLHLVVTGPYTSVGGGGGGALVASAPRTQPAFQGSAYRDGDLTDGGTATGGAVVAIAGGTAPYTCSLSAGSLPAGMTMAEVAPASYPPGLCVLSGTPSAAGSYPMTVKVQDAASNSASQAVAFTVLSSSLPVFTNVTATSVSPTQEAITWTTSVAASSKVCSSIGNDVVTCTPETDTAGVTAHSVTLGNLWPSQSYQYFVESRGVAGGAPQDSLASTDGPGCCSDTFAAAAAPTTGTSTMFAVPVGPHNVTPGSPLYVGVYYGPTLGKTSSANPQFIITGLPPNTRVHWPDLQDNNSMQGTVSTTSTPDDTITFSGLGGSGTTMFEIETNVGGSTPAGSYTLNVSGNVIVGGSTVSTANNTWAMAVAPQAFSGNRATAFPAIPDLALWQTDMTFPWPQGSGTTGYWYNQQQRGGACEWDND
ncbi:MAG TPA: putative Ig domain-containing protein, partial [Terriglobales bacterium]|nr:putative Ig domain-containing protein [Terriglobales bacterium]